MSKQPSWAIGLTLVQDWSSANWLWAGSWRTACSTNCGTSTGSRIWRSCFSSSWVNGTMSVLDRRLILGRVLVRQFANSPRHMRRQMGLAIFLSSALPRPTMTCVRNRAKKGRQLWAAELTRGMGGSNEALSPSDFPAISYAQGGPHTYATDAPTRQRRQLGNAPRGRCFNRVGSKCRNVRA